MASSKFKTARIVAAEVLDQTDLKHDYAGAILNRLLVQTDQKQHATDIVFGVVRNKSAIDVVISLLAAPVERIAGKLRNIVRIGVYEFLYNPGTADYAIVNEAVENAKIVGSKKQAGFVNAVLRNILRGIKSRQVELSDLRSTKILPHSISAGCEFIADIFPDKQKDPAEYFSCVFSLPIWLVKDWIEQFKVVKAGQICAACNRRPSIYARANRLKITTEQLAEKFEQNGIEAEIICDSVVRIKSPQAVGGMPGFAEGLFSIQDITAAQPAGQMLIKSGWKVLDLCAAPGGKTCQMAELADDKASIIATDIDGGRLLKVRENIARLGIKNVTVVKYEDFQKDFSSDNKFDAVMLDVPCSNTGVLSRRAEVRYRISLKSIKNLTGIQSELLKDASGFVKDGGEICYSTCSIQKCENTDVVKNFLKNNTSFAVKFEKLILPSANDFGCDGGYFAIIKKTTR